MTVTELSGQPSCCLPCPAADWLFPDDFKKKANASEWLNVFGLILLVFMLVSYALLPPVKTRRHYLSTCLVLAIAAIAIGFIIPLGAQPEQCFNEITPNDMYSSLECAFSGSFILFGGLCTTTWIAVRALSMNLQICWDIIPGKKFMYASHAVGWGLPAIFFAATMASTGVSFRFGSACHINHDNSIAVFWGPLLAQAAIAGILQLCTFGYCIRVYLKSLWGADAPGNSTNASGGLPSYNGSLRAQTTRAVFQRLQKVLFLQWRGLGIVSIILVDVIFFSVVFVHVDRLAAAALADFSVTAPWIDCLVSHPTDKEQCVDLVSTWLVNVETVEAVLFLLALAGLQCFLMMTRPSFFTAWNDLFRRHWPRRKEFVSLNAQNSGAMHSKQDVLKYEQGHLSATFEMQKPGQNLDRYSSSEESERRSIHLDKGMIESIAQVSNPTRSPFTNDQAWPHREGKSSPPAQVHPSPPTPAYISGLQRNPPDYFSSHRRNTSSDDNSKRYQPPLRSFSAARPPSQDGSMRSQTFDARESYSRGGYTLSPPSEAGESEAELMPTRYWPSNGKR